jgi:hypothetical protein
VVVPHGLRSGWEREQRRRELVDAAVAAADLDSYAAILVSIAPEDWFGFWPELVLRVGVPIVPERVVHRHAKARALAAEDQPRRRVERPAAD